MRMAKVDGVDGAKSRDISKTEAAKAMTIKTINLILLYINGNNKIHQTEKVECCNDFPTLRNFLAPNCSIADIETNIKKGISFKTSPSIKKNPYSSGKIKKFGGLSKPVNHGEKSLKNKPLGENINIKPIPIVIWGRARNGDIIVFKNW